jgi:hypothetical protein
VVIGYGLRHWQALSEFLSDGRLEMDTLVQAIIQSKVESYEGAYQSASKITVKDSTRQ